MDGCSVATVGRSTSSPTAYLEVTRSPSESLMARSFPPDSLLCASTLVTGRASTLSIPLPKTYTPPPTAPALHPTCAISAPPPYLMIMDPNPGPNIPIERKCLLIRFIAYCALVESAVSCDNDKASNGCCRAEGILKWEASTCASEFAPISLVRESSVSVFSCNTCLRNFIRARLSWAEMVLSENTSSRPLGIFCNIPFHC